MSGNSHSLRARGRVYAVLLIMTGLSCSGTFSGPTTSSCDDSNAPLPASSITVTLDVGRQFQTLQGFGTSVRLFDDPHVTNTSDPVTQRGAVVVPPAEQARILDALYVELGLTRLRWHPEGSRTGVGGIEPVNDNNDPDLTDLSKFFFAWKRNDGYIDYVKAVRPRGVTTFFASPLTLESWMSESMPAEYVEWAMAILRRWRSQGVEMPYYSIANEFGGPGSGFGTDTWLLQVVKRLGAKLQAEGFATRIVVTDDVNAQAAAEKLRTVLADPEARRYIGALAYHMYVSGADGRAAVKQLSEQYGIPVWMTEYYDTDWMRWAKLMHELLATYDVTAVDYMWGYFGQWESQNGTHLVTITHTGNTYTGFRRNQQYYVMGQYSKFVRPGARRVQAVASDNTLLVTAWRRESELVFVVINDGTADRAVRFELGANAPCVSRVQPVLTTHASQWREVPEITLDQPRFVATIPAGSITTLIAR